MPAGKTNSARGNKSIPFASPGGLPVRLKRAGIRMGLHAKSMVVDEAVGVVGTHNFDPRGDTLNTESAVVIADPAFARAFFSIWLGAGTRSPELREALLGLNASDA